MTKDQETPVTETQNSGESGQKTSKPKSRASARGKSATASEATAGQAEKTSSRPSPASKTSSSSSPSADTPAPKASKPRAGKSTATKPVAASKSTAAKAGSAEDASAAKGAAKTKTVEKTATKAKSTAKPAVKSKAAAGSEAEGVEKTVKKAKAEEKTPGAASSAAAAPKRTAPKAATAKSKQATTKSTGKPAAGTAKSGSEDAPADKTASAAAGAKTAKSATKATAGTAAPKAVAAKAPDAKDAAPSVAQSPKSASQTGEKLPGADAAKAPADTAANKVQTAAPSAAAKDGTVAAGAPEAGAKAASAARSRAATKVRAATARKKTTDKSADKSAAEGRVAPAQPKSTAAAATVAGAAEKISPPSAGATAPAMPTPPASSSAREGKDLTPPAPAAAVAEHAAEHTAGQPRSAANAEKAKPAASSAAHPTAAHGTVKTETAVLALAATERLALTGRNSLAIENTELLALTLTTSETVPQEENGAGAEASETSGEVPRRKNRRGRRGGRGRNRKKELNGENGDALAAGTSAADSVHSEDSLQNEDEGFSAESPQAPAVSGNAPDEAAAKESPGAAPAASSKKTAPTETGKHKSKSESANARRRMFISVLPGEQVEVALTEDGQLLEYYLDMLHQRKIKGNIYKGVIHNIDTNLQAAFVSYGAGKNGFLQIDEIHPEYWLTHHEPAKGKKFPPIQKVLKAGQEVLVQVVKEPTGSKGAFLTTWLSLAGRFLVLTPGQEQIGVSRKVDDEEERSRLREMMNGIDPGQGLGVIVRTVSAGTTKTTLKNDLQYLKRVWRDIRKKATEVTAPSLIYQEPGLSERAVRDYLTDDVGEIWVDNEDVAQSIRETVNLLFPRKSDLVRLHSDVRTSMWERFSLRRQLDQIYTREVLLPSGGRLVFDQTEALMAVDINSGKISGKGNFEAMAHKTNMEAAETIARHLKLRDIGGQVVIDFIEMRDKKHIIEVEKTLRSAMKNDRARHDVGRMSAFGLLELVRQRTGSSALAITMEPCPACGGTGQRRNLEWQALQALRELRRMLRAESKEKCVYGTSAELALYLLNHKRDSLREMEQDYGKCLEISVRP
uniref:Ribonuclease G n=1 Tax=Desulfovibrio desulfuricans (strain ATCC 27774 / DSM 6949 / MB) TaxID=525146 RepID=B8IYX2_DESDA